MKHKSRTEQTLEFLKSYILTYGYSPSLRDIAESLGTSTSVINYALMKLQMAGRIEKADGKARSIRLVDEE